MCAPLGTYLASPRLLLERASYEIQQAQQRAVHRRSLHYVTYPSAGKTLVLTRGVRSRKTDLAVNGGFLLPNDIPQMQSK